MAHQSLYRKYRPQSFEDVVGQAHVTRTLRNAVTESAVAHAYLFTGPRGTGKTTTARILAKALECESGPTPDPDSTCEQCVAITEGRHPDVYELDAASRTQVDAVREEIIGRLVYPPVRGAWKLYIIDEVHMLSNHSFNALLKSIEEPPPHTIFVLCTTHPHKVPETIHSRCQRFDFHRIGVDDIVGRLEHIAKAERIEVAPGTLALVAKHAGGGMRDAISLLEQLAAFSGSSISLADVEGLLGEVDSALLFEVADLIARRDVAGSFEFVARIASAGVDIPEFVRELVGHVRDLYVVAAVGDATGIVEAPTSDLARLTSQAAAFGPDRLARVLDLLGELTGEMRWSPDPRLALEVILTRLARPHGEMTLEALAERVEALETGVAMAASGPSAPAAGASAGHVPPPADPADPRPAQTAVAPKLDAQQAGTADDAEERGTSSPEPAQDASDDESGVPAPETTTPPPATSIAPLDRAHVKRAWPAVVAEVRKLKSARGAMFDGTEVDVDTDGVTLVVEFPSSARFPMKQAQGPDNVALLKRALASVFGSVPPFRYQLGRGAVRAEEPAPAQVAPGPEPPAPLPEEPHEPPAAPSGSAPGTGDRPAPPTPSGPGGVRTEDATPEDLDIEALMADALGAEKVSERPHIDEGTE